MAKSATKVLQEGYSSKGLLDSYSRLRLFESEAKLIGKYLKKPLRLLDLGCGAGRAAIPLQAKGFQVTGLDITPALIKSARASATKRKSKAAFLQGTAVSLPFKDRSFDSVLLLYNSLEGIPLKENRQAALNESFRVMKPGNYLILSTLSIFNKAYRNPRHWLYRFFRFHWRKLSGRPSKEIEFGDNYPNEEGAGIIFQHISNPFEVMGQIKKAGFELVEFIPLEWAEKRQDRPGFYAFFNYNIVYYVARKP
jgi:ubiquinone/menaquinone biosynthesis C-methylase UbiE